ncbi:ABC transporter permease [Luteimonas viscosa]|uniref:ABC transporter permease n=1 Tax=Luteimonas viscosa TaxID=1132694 RepID=A0A5D4XGT3_9GAMM|nr:ABC transporter permease [Luteimonas viscosa]TYT23689.1 ABC transporter permease [Luteimonas viscosa]
MNAITRKLIAKELYVHRSMMLVASAAAVFAALVSAFGRTAFNVGAIAWITAVIAGGVMLAIYGILNERKEHSLEFVLSLPISIRQYVFAKTFGLLLCFLVPWLAASASAVALVLASPGVPDGLLPYVIALCGYLLANFTVVLCGALHARSEGLMTAVIILTNMSVSVFMFVVGALPGIRNHLESPTPVWNGTVFNVLLVEAVVIVVAVTLPLLTSARRRDFL